MLEGKSDNEPAAAKEKELQPPYSTAQLLVRRRVWFIFSTTLAFISDNNVKQSGFKALRGDTAFLAVVFHVL